MGRPNKFNSKAHISKLIDDYFTIAEAKNRPLTISGLALALNTSRQTLLDYEDKAEFSDTIKRAKLKIENWTEEQLFTNKSVAGVIFNLTNNFGWQNRLRDKTEKEHVCETQYDGFTGLIKDALGLEQ
jgi:hypothetical protein